MFFLSFKVQSFSARQVLMLHATKNPPSNDLSEIQSEILLQPETLMQPFSENYRRDDKKLL